MNVINYSFQFARRCVQGIAEATKLASEACRESAKASLLFSKNVGSLLLEPEKALFRACRVENIPLAKMAFRFGANPNTIDRNGCTPFHAAVDSHSREVLPLLSKKGGDVNRPDIDGKTPLRHAIENGDVKITNDLLESGAKFEFEDMGAILGHAGELLTKMVSIAERYLPHFNAPYYF